MAFYESPKLESGRLAKPHLNLPDQKTMDTIAYKIKLHKRMLLERKKELEIEKNFDFKKELAKRFEQDRRLEAEDEATRKKRKMYAEELREAVKLSLAARREGKVIGDGSVLKEDIDFDSDSVGDFKICRGVWHSLPY